MSLLNTLARKIGFGFLLMILMLASAVGLTITRLGSLGDASSELVELRAPSTNAALTLSSGVNHSVAALRGWLLSLNEQFRNERNIAWAEEINAPLAALQGLASQWEPVDQVRLQEILGVIAELDRYQAEAENLATSDQQAAMALMEQQGAPLVAQFRNLMNQLVDAQGTASEQSLAGISEQVRFLNRMEWALLVLGLAAGTLLALQITRAVTHPVAEAVKVADAIAGGNLDSTVDIHGSLEMDRLGKALTDMRDSLQAKTQQTERFNWLSAGQNRLNEAMRGDLTTEALASSLLGFVATYVGAQVGSLYLVEDKGSRLGLAAGHAYSADATTSAFRMGEGLIGQVAESQTPVLLNDVDAKRVRITSSLLDNPPNSLYVCPFTFEGRTLGTLELGKLGTFTEIELEFMRSSMESIGIAINSAIARKRIQQLLEETQQQSEELQHQQEELEQSNEELEEQTQRLKEQQEELQAANEELEEQTQIVEQKNHDLETARESIELKAKQLETSSKYKSEFLANMSHELRTPLNSLLILANDLAANAHGNLDDEQVESAQVISKSGRDLLHLINDILDLSKVEAGKLDLNVGAIRIAEFANSLMRNFRRTAQEKEVGLRLDMEPELPEILRSDRHRVEQILNNLISNALKFTDHGEVTLRFALASDGSLAVSVQDTGIGIPHDMHAAIFEAFVQVEGGTARRYGGTGLGLSISRELAALLGGKLAVQSEPGEGSSFTLTLPFDRQAPAAPPRIETRAVPARPVASNSDFLDYPSVPDQRGEIQPGDHVVLIIEDDTAFARILAAQAREKGLRHLNAASGEDGLHLAVQYQPHAIILDLDLPGMDGYHVLRELKDDPALRHIPVHIMSVNEKSLDPIRGGAVDYLTKPVSKAQLDSAFARIEDLIDRKMKSLLIVEDDETLRKAIRKLIGNGDVTSHEARTGTEALELLRSQKFDCVVLDVGLPDFSGFELMRRLEGEHPGELPPIIVYTGKELTRRENDELQQYAETIIVKGVKSEERLLDETALFLHRAVDKLPAAKQEVIHRMYDKTHLLTGRKVLVVDDDMRNVFALSKVLKERNMEVIKAEDGVRALQLLDSEPNVDIVLMDIMMPEMDGYECVRRIRAQARFRSLPIICLTAKAMKDDRQKCIDAGANDYIAKPVDIERLVSLMRIWVRK